MFGFWESKISSSIIAEKRIRIQEINKGRRTRTTRKEEKEINEIKEKEEEKEEKDKEDNNLYWIERRPFENGRNCICKINLNNYKISDVTNLDINSRSTVNEYGGGDFYVFNDSDLIITNDLNTKNLKMINEDKNFINLTPLNDPIYRYAEMINDPLQRGYFYAIREDHTIDEPSKVVHTIVAIPCPQNFQEDWIVPTVQSQKILVNPQNDPSILLSTPLIDPTGKFICWMQWSHPNMPWDESYIYVGQLSSDGSEIISTITIAGGPSESVQHPRWIPISHNPLEYSLIYISDKDTGWWNIYRATFVLPNENSQCNSAQLSLTPVIISIGYEFGHSQWMLGTKYFDFIIETSTSCRLVCTWHDVSHVLCGIHCNPYETHILSALDTYSTVLSTITTDITILPIPSHKESENYTSTLTSCHSLIVLNNSEIIILGGSYTSPIGIFHWNISPLENFPFGVLSLLYSSVPQDSFDSIDPSYLSIPQHISFPTFSDSNTERIAYGWYYPPTHPLYAPSGNLSSSIIESNSLPPLLVKCHGGPTGSTSTDYRLDIQYFTSRGFAVFDINYTGSTGYGREYRTQLYRKWGIYDRKDCVYGIQYLIDKGYVDPKKIAIDGSSAGGYTTLSVITFDPHIITAATSSYGIGDLTLLLSDTHKYESHYLTQLIGPYETCSEEYVNRSPINSIETIECSLLLLQGTNDRVVPPNQSQRMYEAVKNKGNPTSLILFDGEGHGWRKAENIKKSLRLELNFYGLLFDFIPDEFEELVLDNKENICMKK